MGAGVEGLSCHYDSFKRCQIISLLCQTLSVASAFTQGASQSPYVDPRGPLLLVIFPRLPVAGTYSFLPHWLPAVQETHKHSSVSGCLPLVASAHGALLQRAAGPPSRSVLKRYSLCEASPDHPV